MNSLTTEAIAMPLPLPLVTRRPVERSSTTAVMSAPLAAASAVACWVRSSRPPKDEAGSSGAASGRGASGPCGATTVSCGASGSTGGGVPYTRASQPVRASTVAVTATSPMAADAYVSSRDLSSGERALLAVAPPVSVSLTGRHGSCVPRVDARDFTACGLVWHN